MATQHKATDLDSHQLFHDVRGENNIKFVEIPITAWRGADGAALGITETAGDFFLQDGTNQLYLQGEESQNETEASVAKTAVMVPTGFNYSRGDKLRLRISGVIDESCGAVDGGSTFDVTVFEQVPTTGAVGSDLCISNAQTVDACGAELDFEINASGLVAGDVLTVVLTASVVESCNSAALRAFVTKTQLLVVT